MRKILLIAIAMVCLAGCSKEKVMQGRYTASTSIGTINIELLAGGNCVASLDGGPESTGFYKIKGDEISISGCMIDNGKDFFSRNHKCYLFNGNNPGKIYDKYSFGIDVKNAYGDDKVFCSFVKR